MLVSMSYKLLQRDVNLEIVFFTLQLKATGFGKKYSGKQHCITLAHKIKSSLHVT